MTVDDIRNKLESYHKAGKKLFISSSFQTHSIPLLHIISTMDFDIDVLFINTGFHFPETLIFRDEIVRLLDLKLVDVKPLIAKSQQKDAAGQFYFVSDPDYCCFMNKTQALEPYLRQYDIWINGVRGDQSEIRKNMSIEQAAPFNTTRFHPILGWSNKMVYEYRMTHKLPEHPLEAAGYQSIGCSPCTRKFDMSDERTSRWFGLNKTECGLHTELIKK